MLLKRFLAAVVAGCLLVSVPGGAAAVEENREPAAAETEVPEEAVPQEAHEEESVELLAETLTYDNLRYTVNSNTVTIVGCWNWVRLHSAAVRR